MTRTEFIQAYARNSPGSLPITDGYHCVGVLRFSQRSSLVALPCACGESGCPGWAMVSPEQVTHHLEFSSPVVLQAAYLLAVKDSGGTG